MVTIENRCLLALICLQRFGGKEDRNDAEKCFDLCGVKIETRKGIFRGKMDGTKSSYRILNDINAI